MPTSSGDQSLTGRKPELIYCPKCPNRVMIINKLKLGTRGKVGALHYVCDECGFECDQPFGETEP